MLVILSALALTTIPSLHSSIVETDCRISINGHLLKANQPLYSWPNKYEFIEPNDEGEIIIPYGYPIELFCPSSFGLTFEKDQSLIAYCLRRQNFRVEGENFVMYNLSYLECQSWPNFRPRRTSYPCNGGTSLVEVGFEVEGGFLHMMDVCYDESKEVTRYVHHKLAPYSIHYQISVQRPRFLQGDFFSEKNVNALYSLDEQQKRFEEILGEGSDKYFNASQNVFLSRGHLSAKADHVYGNQQRATFHFINVAPQWQTFNAGNWARIEDGVRDWVARNKMIVDCYTGTWGVSSLPDYEGIDQELYLNFDENGKGLIPVPKLYFRVVIEKATNKGVVLIGVNNIHITLEKILEEYVICKDVSDLITWIKWSKKNIKLGYSYACKVEEFRSVVRHLPVFNVSGLLY